MPNVFKFINDFISQILKMTKRLKICCVFICFTFDLYCSLYLRLSLTVLTFKFHVVQQSIMTRFLPVFMYIVQLYQEKSKFNEAFFLYCGSTWDGFIGIGLNSPEYTDDRLPAVSQMLGKPICQTQQKWWMAIQKKKISM